ncbi:hypothetical protein RMATCC62417_05902 [Rhizopus microsporus]|nr:hypothetical protein RMATCC62417_05902 [Rhizopus microsporus]
MSQLSAIGVHPKGFSPLLGTHFYSHIVRVQLEYDLAITKITTFLNKQLEDAQNACLRRIFGDSHTSSTTVMLHISKLPTMQERAYALQSQFLLCSLALPEDVLLHHLFPFICRPRSHSQWYKLSRSSIWKRCSPTHSPWIVALYGRYNENIIKTASTINILRMSPFFLRTVAQLSLSALSYGYLCSSLKEVAAYVGALTDSLVVDTKPMLDTLASPSQKPTPFAVFRCTVDS